MNWATAALTVTNRPSDRVATAEVWAAAVKAAGTDSPWGYNRRTFATALRSLLDLSPTGKIWADGKVVNGWVGVRFAAVEAGKRSQQVQHSRTGWLRIWPRRGSRTIACRPRRYGN